MTTPVSPADQLRIDGLTFLVSNPDAKLGDIARACRASRREVSRTLDDLIRDGLINVRHPQLVRIFLVLFGIFGPLAALVDRRGAVLRNRRGALGTGRGRCGIRESIRSSSPRPRTS